MTNTSRRSRILSLWLSVLDPCRYCGAEPRQNWTICPGTGGRLRHLDLGDTSFAVVTEHRDGCLLGPITRVELDSDEPSRAA
jgi:hypothetical protein